MLRAFTVMASGAVTFRFFFGAFSMKALSQQPPHVGMLNYAGPSDIRAKQFRDALRDLGYREGINLRRDNQGARAASIRVRLRRGWGDGGRAEPD